VRREVLGQRHLALVLQTLVGKLDRGREHPPAQIGRTVPRPGCGGEHRLVMRAEAKLQGADRSSSAWSLRSGPGKPSTSRCLTSPGAGAALRMRWETSARPSISALAVGADGNASVPAQIDVQEVLNVNRTLTATERANLRFFTSTYATP